jgi:hypothetical protein
MDHTCVVCRDTLALADSPLCAGCEDIRAAVCQQLTDSILVYESTFCATFERSDEEWVKVSETEMIAVQREPVAEDFEYEVVFEDELVDVQHLSDNDTCIPAPSGL